jgi:hypothetical protein
VTCAQTCLVNLSIRIDTIFTTVHQRFHSFIAVQDVLSTTESAVAFKTFRTVYTVVYGLDVGHPVIIISNETPTAP